MAGLHLEIVTAEKAILSEDDVEQVVAPAVDGVIAIRPPQYAEQMVNAEPQQYRKWGSISLLLIAGSRNPLQKKTSLQNDAHEDTLSYKLSWD